MNREDRRWRQWRTTDLVRRSGRSATGGRARTRAAATLVRGLAAQVDLAGDSGTIHRSAHFAVQAVAIQREHELDQASGFRRRNLEGQAFAIELGVLNGFGFLVLLPPDGASDRVRLLPQFGAHLGVDGGAAGRVVHIHVSRPFAGYIRRHERRGEARQKPEFFHCSLRFLSTPWIAYHVPKQDRIRGLCPVTGKQPLVSSLSGRGRLPKRPPLRRPTRRPPASRACTPRLTHPWEIGRASCRE